MEAVRRLGVAAMEKVVLRSSAEVLSFFFPVFFLVVLLLSFWWPLVAFFCCFWYFLWLGIGGCLASLLQKMSFFCFGRFVLGLRSVIFFFFKIGVQFRRYLLLYIGGVLF